MERKLLSLILALVMVLGVFSPVFAEETVEATEAKPAGNEAVDFLKEQGIIKGDNKGDLLLDQDIDRAQFAAILTRAAGKEDTAQAVAKLGNRFPDIAAGHWANGYANVAFESGWMKGNEKGEFMPEKNISFAEIATTLVRYLNIDTAGYSYPTSYIAKAIELGLFKDVSIQNDYQANAPRKEVFQMLYNAISKDDFGKYNVYKMIVLENSRVAQIGDTKIKAEVLSVVQIANNVGERGTAKVGEQMVFDLKDTKYDVENLLGKVANFTVNEKDELVKVEIDNTFKYLNGQITKKEAKTLGIDWTAYSVRVDERYYEYGKQYRSDRDDRVYRTYLTDSSYRPGSVFAKNYNYEDFAKNAEANYARITVKDGMVIFVDAYNLRDIAPVQKVEREGKDVYYYNDARNGAVERMTPSKDVVTFSEKEGFKRADRSTIKADDVIHWMDGFTLVRTDAPVVGKLEKTYITRDGEFAQIGEDSYYLRTGKKLPLKAVYAYDDQHYRTLNGRDQINDMVGANVKALLDVYGDVQLITSDVKFTDTIGMVDRVLSSKGIQFFAPNAPEEAQYRLEDDWDSNYYRSGWNGTQTRRFDMFNRFDITYNVAEEGKIKTVAALLEFNPSTRKYSHDGNIKDFAFARFTDRDRFLNVGTKSYRYSDDTAVFVVNDIADEKDASVVTKVTMADVKKYNKDNYKLEAVVLTEAQFRDFLENKNKLDIRTYGRFDNRADFAKVVVFTNYNGPQADLESAEIGRIDRIYNYSNDVRIEVTRGQFATFEMTSDSAVIINGKPGKPGDFVLFRRVKNSANTAGAQDGKAKMIEIIGFEYPNVEIVRLNENSIEFKYYNGTTEVKKTLYLDYPTLKEFGDSRYTIADIYTNGSSYAELINFKRERSNVVETITATQRELINAKAFAEAVADITPTRPETAKIQKALDLYEKLTERERKLKIAEDAKKQLDTLISISLGTADELKAKATKLTEELEKITEIKDAETLANAKKLLADANDILPSLVEPEKTALKDEVDRVKPLVDAEEVKDKKTALEKDLNDYIKAKKLEAKNRWDSFELSVKDEQKTSQYYLDAQTAYNTVMNHASETLTGADVAALEKDKENKKTAFDKEFEYFLTQLRTAQNKLTR